MIVLCVDRCWLLLCVVAVVVDRVVCIVVASSSLFVVGWLVVVGCDLRVVSYVVCCILCVLCIMCWFVRVCCRLARVVVVGCWLCFALSGCLYCIDCYLFVLLCVCR